MHRTCPFVVSASNFRFSKIVTPFTPIALPEPRLIAFRALTSSPGFRGHLANASGNLPCLLPFAVSGYDVLQVRRYALTGEHRVGCSCLSGLFVHDVQWEDCQGVDFTVFGVLQSSTLHMDIVHPT